MTYPNKPNYDHGSSGTEPSSSQDYATGDAVDPEHFDYYLGTLFSQIDALLEALETIDSDNDEKVDAADTADEATNVTTTFKGNDIDSDGDGQVNRADRSDLVHGADGDYHEIGPIPTFSDQNTAISETSEGTVFYNSTRQSFETNEG